MKKIKLISSVIVLGVALFSCSDKGTTTTGADINIEDVANKKTSDPNASGENKCLLSYVTKYDQLLTESMVLAATGLPKDKMEFKYSKALDNPEYHNVQYSFMMGRKRYVPAFKGEMALSDFVRLDGIKPKSLTEFKNSYRAMNAEEDKNFEDAKKDVLAGNGEGKEALDKAKKTGIDKETLKKGVDKVGGILKDIAKAYVNIEGVGDAAVWNTVTNEMIVLQKGVQFKLEVNVSGEDSKNRSTAVTLAKQILEKCK